jgi:hypothetical protein
MSQRPKEQGRVAAEQAYLDSSVKGENESGSLVRQAVSLAAVGVRLEGRTAVVSPASSCSDSVLRAMRVYARTVPIG